MFHPKISKADKPFIRALLVALVLFAGLAFPIDQAHAEPSREAQAEKAEGDRLAGAGDLQAAMAAYRRALEMEPSFALARNELGAVLFRLGRMPEAVTEFEQAVGLDPEYATAWFNLAFASRRLERWESAARAYGKHTELRPAEAEAWHGLGESLVALDRKTEAADALEAYAARETRPARQERARQARERAVELREEARRAEAEAAEAGAREAERAAAEAREREAAEAAAREAAAVRAGGDERSTARAPAHGDEPRPIGGRGVEPASAVRDAPEAGSRDVIASGDELLQAGDPGKATEFYARALTADPDNVEAIYKLAFAQARLGRSEEAIRGWERVLELQPENAGARRNIETTRAQLSAEAAGPGAERTEARAEEAVARGQRRVARAEEPAVRAEEPAARAEPPPVDRAGAREAYQEGVRLMGERGYEEAVSVFADALSKDPGLVQAHVAMGSCYIGLRRYPDAKREYEAALRIRPGMAAPLFGLGEAHRALGEAERAKEYYRRYLDSTANDVDPNLTAQAQRWVDRL